MSDEEEKEELPLALQNRTDAPYIPKMREPTMLYRHPAIEPDAISLEGDIYDSCIVDASEVDAAIAAGWFRVWTEARAATEAATAEGSADVATTRRVRK